MLNISQGNCKSTMKYHFTHIKMATIKKKKQTQKTKKKITIIVKDVGKLCTACGNAKWCSHYETVWFHQKLKRVTT